MLSLQPMRDMNQELTSLLKWSKEKSIALTKDDCLALLAIDKAGVYHWETCGQAENNPLRNYTASDLQSAAPEFCSECIQKIIFRRQNNFGYFDVQDVIKELSLVRKLWKNPEDASCFKERMAVYSVLTDEPLVEIKLYEALAFETDEEWISKEALPEIELFARRNPSEAKEIIRNWIKEQYDHVIEPSEKKALMASSYYEQFEERYDDGEWYLDHEYPRLLAGLMCEPRGHLPYVQIDADLAQMIDFLARARGFDFYPPDMTQEEFYNFTTSQFIVLNEEMDAGELTGFKALYETFTRNRSSLPLKEAYESYLKL